MGPLPSCSQAPLSAGRRAAAGSGDQRWPLTSFGSPGCFRKSATHRPQREKNLVSSLLTNTTRLMSTVVQFCKGLLIHSRNSPSADKLSVQYPAQGIQSPFASNGHVSLHPFEGREAAQRGTAEKGTEHCLLELLPAAPGPRTLSQMGCRTSNATWATSSTRSNWHVVCSDFLIRIPVGLARELQS